MKALLQRFTASFGFIMLLGTAAIDSHPAVVLAWIATAILLLLAGRAVTFQQRANHDE